MHYLIHDQNLKDILTSLRLNPWVIVMDAKAPFLITPHMESSSEFAQTNSMWH